MTIKNHKMPDSEVEDVDAYISNSNFNDTLSQEEDLWASDNESILKLLRQSSFKEQPEILKRKIKEAVANHFFYLEDIELGTLPKYFYPKK